MIIDVKNLVKKYKNHVAVDGIDLSIKEGEIFGLLGPNGAGKSTTINSMVGLLKVNDGSITIFGKDFAKHSREIKQDVGYVPQDLAFFEELSAYDNVLYWAKLFGLKKAELKGAVREALEFTGLWDRRKEKPNKFSGGMKRRLNIACAIVHKPKLLFMDEPTVGVDPQSRNNILESIKTLNKNGTTVIYTSHYMEEIEAICDRVAIMDFGKIIALGTIDELIDSISDEENVSVEFDKVDSKLVDLVKKIKGVKDCTSENNRLNVKLNKKLANISKILNVLLENNIVIRSINTDKPNLEMVFLALTGKKLRD